ncbi:hypothetical protein SEA_HOLLIDAY_65 [Gordonia phage Holliday]|nr:hypothetical protein SEA_HOLLIDAY_65 [Gordonia phage Holliday]
MDADVLRSWAIDAQRTLAGLMSENAELMLSRAELADENEKLRNWRDGDRNRNELIQQRVVLAAMERALEGHPECDQHGPDDVIKCGWKRAVADVRKALAGGES